MRSSPGGAKRRRRRARRPSPRADREREVSEALKVYALLASSADTGAVRRLPKEC